MIGKVGRDTFGALLANLPGEKGICTDGIAEDPAVFTTPAFVTPDETGTREFSFACFAASLSTQTRGGINSVVPEEQVQAIL